MLKHLSLKNFRCFETYDVPFRGRTIIVGANNAGKSTITEALRLIGTVLDRYTALNFSAPPDWTELPRRNFGVKPSLKGLNFNDKTCFYQYGEPPSIITATMTSGHVVSIYVGRDGAVFGTLTNKDGFPVDSKARALALRLPRFSIMPPIGPLNREERLLSTDYVRSTLSSHLAPQHFRNQIHHFREHFETLCQLASATWPRLRVRSIEVSSRSELTLALMVQDSSFVTEVGWMGHGLQMWLQVMWFLARSAHAESVFLDEPDVYMHPDLQRKVTLVQVVVPSREDIPKYGELKAQIQRTVSEINGRYGEPGWVPIHYIHRSLDRLELLAFYRAANIALVTPLKDGMNLIAKEYCAARVNDDGVLILSEFAGAAFQLHRGALLVNPYHTRAVADAIRMACEMPLAQQKKRMSRLKATVRRENIFWWRNSFCRYREEMIRVSSAGPQSAESGQRRRGATA